MVTNYERFSQEGAPTSDGLPPPPWESQSTDDNQSGGPQYSQQQGLQPNDQGLNMSLGDMTSLLNSWRLIVCSGLDPNPSNLVATTTFYSETTQAMSCLVSFRSITS